MIDYHAHAEALQTVRKAIDQAGSGSYASAWAETKSAIDAEPACALLGTLFDHLLERAEGADLEHALLEEAAPLFKDAQAALAGFADARNDFEGMMKAPATATTDQFNALVGRLQGLEPKLKALRDRADAFRLKLTPPFKHIAPHGIATDQPVSAWLWRDVVLSRRTDALAAAFQTASDGSAATKAFAFGVLAGYAANCAGSSYLSHAVRGPRRSHSLRDRIARYAVGSWLHRHRPDLCPSLTAIRTSLVSSGTALPAAVRTQITTALAAAFPAGAPASPPDLDAGFSKLLLHLELLQSFQRPPAAPEIDPSLLVQALQSPAATNALVKPQDWPGPINNPAPGEPGHDPLPPPPVDTGAASGDPKSSNSCGLLVLTILLVITIVGLIVWKLVVGRWPWETSAQAEHPGQSSQALSSFLGSENALMMVSYFYNAHTLLTLSLSAGLKNMKLAGLLYPDELDLLESSFGQFTALPEIGSHPHRPVPDPDISYLQAPVSPIEEPRTAPSPYPTGAKPAVFLTGAPVSLPNAGQLGAELWLRHQEQPAAPGENQNADADRGYGHLCWRVSGGAPIATNPLPVTVLGYGEVD